MQALKQEQPNWAGKSDFWEKMAERYPLPFEAKTLERTKRVLDLIRKRGVDFAKAEILDIGCGTGVYTLPLAREGAASVTGLDGSAVMLARMASVAELHGITNVKPVKASWKDLDISCLGFEQAFDVVIGSMTPALQTEHDFANMERCARKWCVYVGWGAKRENALLKEVFEAHGLEFKVPPGFVEAGAALAGLGRKPSLDRWESRREWNGTLAEATENVALQIEAHGAQPQRSLIEGIVSSYAANGQVRHTTTIEQGLLVWRVDQSA